MSASSPVEFLVFGASGYFGSELVRYLQKGGYSFAVSKARIQYRDQIEAAINEHQPKYVLNAAGLAGTPNIVRFSAAHSSFSISCRVTSYFDIFRHPNYYHMLDMQFCHTKDLFRIFRHAGPLAFASSPLVLTAVSSFVWLLQVGLV
jgi:hypothetical protein